MAQQKTYISYETVKLQLFEFCTVIQGLCTQKGKIQKVLFHFGFDSANHLPGERA